MIKTYTQPNKIKTLAIFGLFCTNTVMFYIFIEILSTEADLIEYIYYLLSCFSFWIAINYVLITQLKEKVVIDSNSITLHSTFYKKTIQLEDIKGFQIKNKNIYLIPKIKGTKGMSFSDNLIGEEKIIDYFVSNKTEVKAPERNKWSN